MAALVKEAVTDVIDKERHGVHEGSARMADEDCNCLTPTAARYGDKPTSRRTEGPTGGVNVDPNLEGSTALAICGRSLIARAAGMTKKPANREGLANQQVLERILHFRDIPESMAFQGVGTWAQKGRSRMLARWEHDLTKDCELPTLLVKAL